APVMYLFAGLVFDSLPLPRSAQRLAQLGLLALTPVAISLNLQEYASWMADPATADAREPAVLNSEFARWQDLQMAPARNGEPGFPVSEWQVIRRTLGPAPGAGGGPAAPARVPTPVAIQATLLATI